MKLQFDQRGLIPVIAQDSGTGEVLMLAYMNEEALARTMETGRAWYFSRSRQDLWQKGETSGNRQWVQRISYDCDQDCLLLQVRQEGNACHTGAPSCFFSDLWMVEAGEVSSSQSLTELYQLLLNRKQDAPPNSYTAELFRGGIDRIAKKVVEEAGEVVIAAKNQSKAELIYEVADLCFHTLVLLANQEVTPQEIVLELARRRK